MKEEPEAWGASAGAASAEDAREARRRMEEYEGMVAVVWNVMLWVVM